MKTLRTNRDLGDARSRAVVYEAGLEASRRKRLGQFFSGLPLSRLLATVAIDVGASTVIDPMAGHGDLLDAVIERATRRGWSLKRVQGVEIDGPTAEMCRQRLSAWDRFVSEEVLTIRSGNAFDAVAVDYSTEGYDLVITNPPYVRYQTLSNGVGEGSYLTPDEIRRNLQEIIKPRLEADEWPIWRMLIDGYSGLSDLSIPAWILSAALVRRGGVLALVAPTTWRSRNYGDTIEYLLERCFHIEYLIEDTQPGWFSNALVRTQLVIARRRSLEEVLIPLLDRIPDGRRCASVKVSPQARANDSLVGAAFPGDDPELSFAEWLRNLTDSDRNPTTGLDWEVGTTISESVLTHGRRRRWFRALEPAGIDGSLFQMKHAPASIIPIPLKKLFEAIPEVSPVLPEEVGLSISQGLRTGCNGFFYVDMIEEMADGCVRIRTGPLFDNKELVVPADCVAPVVRRQSEVSGPVKTAALTGRVLYLRNWILPEDLDDVGRVKASYEREGLAVPKVMSEALADMVRRAASTVYENGGTSKRISELSAVRTNVRSKKGDRTPQSWYMLPPFAKRHRPDAFVARVNQSIPWVEVNADVPVLVDANFSTIWGASSGWTRFAIRGVLNSSWCRACMEALGTPLGGGALKLEATQLKKLPLPRLSSTDMAYLDSVGRLVSPSAPHDGIDRLVVSRMTNLDAESVKVTELVENVRMTAAQLCLSRQR